MSLQNHLSELQRRHHALDREIDKERLHPAADTTKVAAMKRRKLVLKDEIAKLRQDAQDPALQDPIMRDSTMEEPTVH